jgi:hypothetical protein
MLFPCIGICVLKVARTWDSFVTADFLVFNMFCWCVCVHLYS